MGKKKKELGLDSMGIQKSMRLTDYLGDGIGQLPLNIIMIQRRKPRPFARTSEG